MTKRNYLQRVKLITSFADIKETCLFIVDIMENEKGLIGRKKASRNFYRFFCILIDFKKISRNLRINIAGA